METMEAKDVRNAMNMEPQSTIDEIKRAVTPDGILVLTRVNIDPKYKFEEREDYISSRVQANAMLIAVGAKDRGLFEQLYKGYQKLLPKDQDFPPIAQKLIGEKEDEILDATAIQVYALSLIEAGKKWGGNNWQNNVYTKEGVELAKKFLNSNFVGSIPLVNGSKLSVINGNGKTQGTSIKGREIYFVDPSLYNYKLFELMSELDKENFPRWNLLQGSGVVILSQAVEPRRNEKDKSSIPFKFIPRRIPVYAGAVINYSEVGNLIKDDSVDINDVPLRDAIKGEKWEYFDIAAAEVYHKLSECRDLLSNIPFKALAESLTKVWIDSYLKGTNILAESGSTYNAMLEPVGFGHVLTLINALNRFEASNLYQIFRRRVDSANIFNYSLANKIEILLIEQKLKNLHDKNDSLIMSAAQKVSTSRGTSAFL